MRQSTIPLVFIAGCLVYLAACGYEKKPEPASVNLTTCKFGKYSYRYGMQDSAEISGIQVNDIDMAGVSAQEFFEEIKNGSEQYDIFLVYGEQAGSKRYWDEHLYTDISSSPILVEAVSRMYKSIGDSAWSGEELMGVPVDAAGAVLAYQEEAVSGLSESKIPSDTWDDFLSFAESLPQGVTVLANKAGLYSCLFHQYLAGYGDLSEASPYSVDYDTKAFRAVLDDMKRISKCDAFQEPGESGDAGYRNDGDFRRTDILGLNKWLDIRFIRSPDRLPCIESGVAIPAQIQVVYAVVNPNSPRKKAAIQYLEALVSADAYRRAVNLFPDDARKEQKRYMENALVFYEFGIYREAEDILDDFRNGKISVEETIFFVQQKTDDILREYGDKK